MQQFIHIQSQLVVFRHWCILFLGCILLSILFFASPISITYPDFDGSFHWVYNYFYAHQASFFCKAMHEVGPLVFLKWPYPISNHLWVSALFLVVIRIAMGVQLFYLFVKSHSHFHIVSWVSLYVILLVVTNIESVFYANFLIGSMAYYLSKQWQSFVFNILLLVIGMFVKTTISVPLLCIAGSLFIVMIVRKQWQHLAIFFTIFFIALLCISFPIYKSVVAIFLYLYNDVLMVFTYNGDTNIYVSNHWFYLPLLLIPIVIYPVLVRQHRTFAMYAIGSLFLFAIWKYILGRQDFEHYYTGLPVITIWCAVLYVFQSKLKHKLLICSIYLMSITGYVRNMYSNIGDHSFYFNTPNIGQAYLELCTPNVYKSSIKNIVDSLHTTQILPKRFLDSIGNNLVDVYPWELSFLNVNNLKPRFRPFLQTAVGGMRGDVNDALHLGGCISPAFIIWHASEPTFTKLNAFDNKFLPNEYPLSFMAIAMQYTCIDSFDNRVYLMKKNKINQLISIDTQRLNTLSGYNHCLQIPAGDSSHFYKIKCIIKLSQLQKIKSFLYKTPAYSIHYKLTDGSVYRFNVSARALSNGVFANCIYLNPILASLPVKSVSISCNALPDNSPIDVDVMKYSLQNSLR